MVMIVCVCVRAARACVRAFDRLLLFLTREHQRFGIPAAVLMSAFTHPLWARAWRGVHGCLCGEEAGDESLLLSFVDEVQDDLSLP